MGAGGAWQQSVGYNYNTNFWSTTSGFSAYAALGPLHAGGNFSINYNFTSGQWSSSQGWGVGLGLSTGGGDPLGYRSFGLSVGYGSDCWTYGVNGSYASQSEKRNYMIEQFRYEIDNDPKLQNSHGSVYNTTKIRSSLLPRQAGYGGRTITLDEIITGTESRSTKQWIVINRYLVSKYYRGNDQLRIKAIVFHEYYHANEFHDGLESHVFRNIDPATGRAYHYGADPMEIRAYSYSIRRFGIGSEYFNYGGDWHYYHFPHLYPH